MAVGGGDRYDADCEGPPTWFFASPTPESTRGYPFGAREPRRSQRAVYSSAGILAVFTAPKACVLLRGMGFAMGGEPGFSSSRRAGEMRSQGKTASAPPSDPWS